MAPIRLVRDGTSAKTGDRGISPRLMAQVRKGARARQWRLWEASLSFTSRVFLGGGLEQYFFGFGVPTCSKEVPDGSSESPIDDNLDWFGGKPFFTHAAAAEG